MADILIGPAVDKLLDVVISTIEKALVFKKELNRIKETLEDLEPLIKKMEKMNKKLDLPLSNTKKFMAVLEEGKQLVAESESLSQLRNAHKRPGHTDKLHELDKSLSELMQRVVLQLIIDGMENLELGRETFFLVAKLHDHMERNKMENLAQNDVDTNILDLSREVLASVTEMRTDLNRSQEENLTQKDANTNILNLLREILARFSEPQAADMKRSQEEISAQIRAVYAAPLPPKFVVGFDTQTLRKDNEIKGAALEVALREPVDKLKEIIKNAVSWRETLQNIMAKLENLQPLVAEIKKLSGELDQNQTEILGFDKLISKATKLVDQYPKVSKSMNIFKKSSYAEKLRELDESLDQWLKLLQAYQSNDVKGILKLVSQLQEMVLGLYESENLEQSQISSTRYCEVPEAPNFTIGLDATLQELKADLLKEDSSVLVLTAPPGYGKTTLAQRLCKETEIKEKFKRNIMFVKVSKTDDLNLIIQNLYQHNSRTAPTFRDEEDAQNRLEQLLKDIGPSPILLILDDVWFESEYLIDKFRFQIPEYKILVTSRFEFPAYGPIYKLKPLNHEDAEILFRKHAKLEEGSSKIPKDLVKEVVQHCKKVPLALKLIGLSLGGRPREIWKRELKRWSKWDSSVLDFKDELLLRLKSSLDVLGAEDAMLKECFLDLGSFPEDRRIPVTALIDIWTELQELEEDDAIAYLFDLSRSNMANVEVSRKDVDEGDAYYSEHFVTQHDMVRELAIRQSRKDLETKKNRLILEITGKDLPIWWNEPNERTFDAHLVSITTDGKFSSKWCNMNLPEAEILILNFQSENYALPDFLKTMRKLKVLIITNYGFFPAKLSNFNLPGSLTNLKRIRLERIVIPYIGETTTRLLNLQKLSLFMCEVAQAFDSIESSKPFPKLEELNIDFCTDLVELPAGLCDMVKDVLRKLSITNCDNLSVLPEEIGKIYNLEVLRFRSCIGLEQLPESICNLSNLNSLDLYDCSSICTLPKHMDSLTSLTKLNMNGCSRLL